MSTPVKVVAKAKSRKKTVENKRCQDECCKIESVVSIDERGQLVLPKEVREKANIRPGDKMAVVSWGSGDGSCCIVLLKTNGLASMVKVVLGPMAKNVLGE